MSVSWSYLLECQPYDPSIPGVRSVNFASNIYDDAALGQTLPYFVRLKQAFSHESSVFDQNLPGGTVLSSGNAVLANSDGALDYLLDYSWDGRAVRVLRGVPGAAYGTYTVEFSGSSLEMTADGDNLVLALRDNSWKLAKPLQSHTYLGTGGKEGGAELKEKRKPLLFGTARNLTPVTLDNARLIFQFHDGSAASVSKVYDRAVPLDFSGNYSTYSALQSASVPAGFYATCLAEGVLKLGAKLVGQLTVDATGAYSTSADLPALIKNIVKDYGGLTDGDLDLTLFTQASADASYGYEGIYLQEPDLQIDQLVESLCASFNGFWFLTRAGKLAVRQFKFRTPSYTLREEDLSGLQRQSSPNEIYRVKLNYAKNCTVQEAGSFTLPNQTLNGFLSDNLVYVSTAADGSGGTYTYTGEFSVYLNRTKINDLGTVQFKNVTGSSWCTINSSGVITISDPGVDSASVVLSATLGEFIVTEVFTVAKAKAPSPKTLALATNLRHFYYDSSNTAVPSVQTATLTATGTNLTTPYSWGAVDNLGNSITISSTTATATLPITSLVNSVLASWVMVTATSANGVQNTVQMNILHGDDGYGSGILSALSAANSVFTIYYQATTPTGASTGDYWYDTDDGNKLYRYDGTVWTAVTDSRIIDALSAAATAQGTADGKVKTFLTETTPTATAVGDLWYQPSTKILKRWDGSSWVGVSTWGADANGQIFDSGGAGGLTTPVTRGNIITSLGTAAAIAGQGALATLNAVAGAQISDYAISLSKFASDIEPITNVTSVPGTKSTNTIYNSTDGKLYRWNGTAYVASVPTSDLLGTVSGSQIGTSTLTAANFASTIEPVSLVSSVPGTKTTNTIFNTTDRKIYRWNGSAYVASVAAADITGTLTGSQIGVGSIDASKFATGVEPTTVVTSVPGTKSTSTIYNSTDGKLYRWNGSAYVASVPAADVTGTIVGSQIADYAVSVSKFSSGLEPVTIVTGSVPTTKSTSTIFLNGKLYRWNGTAYTKDTIAADIDQRGLNILDNSGVPVFGADGTIGPSAYVNLSGNNVLLSTIAANSLVPSITYVGAYSANPTSTDLGTNWKQNAVYKNTTDNKSYILTGTPLAWVVYLESGTNFYLTIESTNGTIFRNGAGSSTTLKAHLFKNGAEVTDVTPTGWFRWRRVSVIARGSPYDDATWNALYASGYTQVTVTVDDVYAKATFFCDVIS